MNRMIRRGLSLLCALVLLAGVWCIPTAADVTGADGLYFGRDVLSAQPERDRLVRAYDIICDGVGEKIESIELEACGLTADEFRMVYEMYYRDHAEHYWIPSGYSVSTRGTTVVALNLSYLTGFDDAAFEAGVAKLLKAADGKTTEYEKALALHDALVRHITYTNGATNAHNAYGAIVGGASVCEGYAEAYQILLNRVGICSFAVIGTGNGEAHEWNLVRLDGKYYYTDVTWDDMGLGGVSEKEKPVFHGYFCLPSAWMGEDHIASDPYNVLPNATATDMLYKGNARMDVYTVDAVAQSFKQVSDCKLVGHVFFTGAVKEQFSPWFDAHFQEIYQKTDFRGASSIQYVLNGREAWICFFAPCDHSFVDMAEKAATCTEDGWDAYRSCTKCRLAQDADGFELEEAPIHRATGHTPGSEATCTVDQVCITCGQVVTPAKGHTPGEWEIVREPSETCDGERMRRCSVCGATLETEVLPAIGEPTPAYTPGDINGDGKVNSKDLTRLIKHLSGEAVDVVEDALDLNGDGKVNMKDYTRLLKYLSGEEVELH